MDYKELACAVRLCGSTPKVDQCRECPYWADGDMSKCIPRMTEDAANAIIDQTARAEAAENRVHELETTHRTEMCEDGYDCVELGKVRNALAEAEKKVEKAERERDAAVRDLRQMCVGGNTCAFCKYGRNCGKQGPGRKTVEPCWEWRGQKEE